MSAKPLGNSVISRNWFAVSKKKCSAECRGVVVGHGKLTMNQRVAIHNVHPVHVQPFIGGCTVRPLRRGNVSTGRTGTL